MGKSWKFVLLLGLIWGLTSGCGDKFGICYTYYDDGETVRSEVPCNKSKGFKNGTMRIYRKNGDLWTTKVYIDNVVEDTTKYYYSRSGEILKTVPMLHGKKHGVAMEYFEDGALKREQPYLDGKKEGFHRIFDENGRLLSEEYFNKGLKEKKARYYYEKVDQLKEQISYIQDLRNGAYEKYDDRGKLLLKGQYKNDRPSGEWTFRTNVGIMKTATVAEIKYAFKRDIKELDDYFYEHL